jgi:hypothetical protein
VGSAATMHGWRGHTSPDQFPRYFYYSDDEIGYPSRILGLFIPGTKDVGTDHIYRERLVK